MAELAENLSQAIRKMIELKCRRDNIKFTAYKLAQLTGVDKSLIQRLLSGKIQNPRLDTIIKIIDFFIKDGFPISLNDVMQWKSDIISVEKQPLIKCSQVTLPLFHMKYFNHDKIGDVSLELPSCSPGTIAVLANEDIDETFKAGSIFIVDMIKHPENKNMVLYMEHAEKSLIPAKLIHTEKVIELEPFTENIKPLQLPIEKAKELILGVVVRVNIKTVC